MYTLAYIHPVDTAYCILCVPAVHTLLKVNKHPPVSPGLSLSLAGDDVDPVPANPLYTDNPL